MSLTDEQLGKIFRAAVMGALPPDRVHVDATNFKAICTNLDAIDFTGTTDKIVKMTSVHCNMEIPNNYENPRMVFKGKVIKGVAPYWLQLKQKGGSHMNADPCPGCAYALRVQPDGTITFVKELEHIDNKIGSGYTGNRRDPLPTTFKKVSLNVDHMIEFDCINTPSTVRLIGRVDGAVSATYEDRGGWLCDDPAFRANCDARQFGNTGYRKRDELLQKAGEKSILRIDGSVLQWDYVDVIKG
jgi:hypothetical protein